VEREEEDRERERGGEGEGKRIIFISFFSYLKYINKNIYMAQT